MAIVSSHLRKGRPVISHSRNILRRKRAGNREIVDIDFNFDRRADLRVVTKPDKDRGTKATRNPLTGELTGRRIASGGSIDNRTVNRISEQRPLPGLRLVRNPSQAKLRYRVGGILGRRAD